MRQTLYRAGKFLNLVALLAALLAAVAVGIASRDFASRHLDDCAMLRVLGLSQRTIAWQYFLEFMVVGAIASFAGAFILYRWAVNEEVFEGLLYLGSALIVGSMMVWMWRHAHSLSG